MGTRICHAVRAKTWCSGKKEDIERVLREENELVEMVQQERMMKKRMLALSKEE